MIPQGLGLPPHFSILLEPPSSLTYNTPQIYNRRLQSKQLSSEAREELELESAAL